MNSLANRNRNRYSLKYLQQTKLFKSVYLKFSSLLSENFKTSRIPVLFNFFSVIKVCLNRKNCLSTQLILILFVGILQYSSKKLQKLIVMCRIVANENPQIRISCFIHSMANDLIRRDLTQYSTL